MDLTRPSEEEEAGRRRDIDDFRLVEADAGLAEACFGGPCLGEVACRGEVACLGEVGCRREVGCRAEELDFGGLDLLLLQAKRSLDSVGMGQSMSCSDGPVRATLCDM